MIETVDTIDIKQLLGKQIKELRVQRGYTQEYLSEKIGIGQRNLSKVECGNNFITAETLSRLLFVIVSLCKTVLLGMEKISIL